MSKKNEDKKKNKINKQKEDVEKLKAQAEENLAGWQRSRADYLNLQKESENKIKNVSKVIKSDFLQELLPIYNNLQVAFSHIPKIEQEKSWAVGLKHIVKQLDDFFASQGLLKIETKNQEFNHNIHEAVKTEWHKNIKENMIVKEISPGFKLNNEILLPAKVIVNKKI